MSAYGNIEKRLAMVANRFPGIKPMAKLCYQHLNHYLFKRPYDLQLAKGISMKQISGLNKKESFWGYYDSSPFGKKGYLFHSLKKMNPGKYKENQVIDIMFSDKKISESNSWNWQQGSRLFWFDDQHILHNILDRNSVRTKLLNIRTGKFRLIDSSVYAYHHPSQKALGINFERLGYFDPAYGYPNQSEFQEIVFNDKEDGIFHIDIQNNRSKLIISFDQLKRFHKKSSMDKAGHSVNHLQISPGGKRFIFIHRWYLPDGRKFSRLMSSDLNGNELYLLADEGMVSHCNWKNDDEIVGWMKMKNENNAYYLLKDQTEKFEKFYPEFLNEDGHPSFSPCGKYMLTDTYPDRSRMSHLLLFCIPDQKLTVLGSFYAPLKFVNEYRCDLHPRFTSNNKVTIDSVHKGFRQLYELDITQAL
ncbi:hypothetical protein LCM02_00605 [Lutimonas saemankumensis]|uniref:hypothetical protein n=1 Tax=Lutimonas saemankumensis TaxID=483016 RepID=UPI001CD1AB0F|nr:hypothetical protein [Lutimonas saemankumensis]MCA0930928.1 hypothetical protein [Lutimonas saemankumensis]